MPVILAMAEKKHEHTQKNYLWRMNSAAILILNGHNKFSILLWNRGN